MGWFAELNELYSILTVLPDVLGMERTVKVVVKGWRGWCSCLLEKDNQREK